MCPILPDEPEAPPDEVVSTEGKHDALRRFVSTLGPMHPKTAEALKKELAAKKESVVYDEEPLPPVTDELTPPSAEEMVHLMETNLAARVLMDRALKGDTWWYSYGSATNPRVAQVTEWLSHIRYKPDTTFEVFDDRQFYDEVVLKIRRMMPDSTDPTNFEMGNYTDRTRFGPVRVTAPVPRYISDLEHFVEWLHHILLEQERHELDEWLRVDGALPFDPHRNDRDP